LFFQSLERILPNLGNLICVNPVILSETLFCLSVGLPRALFHAVRCFGGDAADEAKEAVEDGERVRRAAGDVEIDREDRVRAVVHFGMVDEPIFGSCQVCRRCAVEMCWCSNLLQTSRNKADTVKLAIRIRVKMLKNFCIQWVHKPKTTTHFPSKSYTVFSILTAGYRMKGPPEMAQAPTAMTIFGFATAS